MCSLRIGQRGATVPPRPQTSKRQNNTLHKQAPDSLETNPDTSKPFCPWTNYASTKTLIKNQASQRLCRSTITIQSSSTRCTSCYTRPECARFPRRATRIPRHVAIRIVFVDRPRYVGRRCCSGLSIGRVKLRQYRSCACMENESKRMPSRNVQKPEIVIWRQTKNRSYTNSICDLQIKQRLPSDHLKMHSWRGAPQSVAMLLAFDNDFSNVGKLLPPYLRACKSKCNFQKTFTER